MAVWSRGKLARLSKPGTQIRYNYNAFGQRIRKTYSGSTDYSCKFCYDESGRLVCETKYSDSGSTVDKIVYLYDANSVIGIDYTVGGVTSTYFLQRNLLGDVIGIYDSSRVKVGGYAYDAWGNCTITLDTTGIAYRNPIRYRGYYYDTETGLYYLNARYYNPEWRRFISPDSTEYLDPESVNGLNLYCYCYNDPISYYDPSGYIPIKIILGVIIVGALAATAHDIFHLASNRVYVNTDKTDSENVRVQNSSKILTPWIRYGYSFYLNHFNPITKDIIQGTSFGFEFEWALHNYAAWLGFGGYSAEHLDAGKSIFADGKNRSFRDEKGNFNPTWAMSLVMRISYVLFANPICWIWDLIVNGGF